VTNVARVSLALSLLVGLSSVAAAQSTPRPVRKGRKYSIKIDSAPQQAAIYLDDKSYGIVGYTPYNDKLIKGDYKIIIELQGYEPMERMVRVEKKGQEFFFPLTKKVQPGMVDVQASADPNVLGAQVLVDNQAEGTAPQLVEVTAGRHQIVIRKEGFNDFEQWVTLKEGERVTLTPILKAKVVAKPKGSLLVDADVPDAEVYINGKLQPDTTPTIIDDLEEGQYVVEVKKAPATAWKQTVMVEAGKRNKVTGKLAATMTQNQGGNVRVLSNVPGAEVWLDGTLKGQTPFDLQGISPGEHLIEVKAKGYVTKEQRIKVNTGSVEIVKIELVTATSAVTTGKIKVVAREPEAEVFIDGARIGTAPIEKDVPPGEHFVVVTRPGFAKFEQKVAVEVGQTLNVSAQLRAVGGLRFLANVEGAEVVLDGAPIGKTPFLKEDVDVGDHIITFRMNGFYDDEKKIAVKAGTLEIVNGDLQRIGATPEEIARMIRGLSSFGAKTIPLGRFTADAALGYPYWIEARATTGVVKDVDVGLGFRTYMTTYEFTGTLRYRFFNREPFAFAVFGMIAGGGGKAGRNQFSLDGGVLASITFQNRVVLSGRAYIDIWSDRLCGLDDMTGAVDGGAPDVCQPGANAMDVARAQDLTGNTVLTDRDTGMRLYLSAVAEAAIYPKMSIFAIFEGAPFQAERAAHTNLFNGTIPFDEDIIYNFKAGATFKF
jgi:hypothetical protein